MKDNRETDPALAALRSGEAWAAFCDELKLAGRDLLRDGAPDSEIALAEGHRYLTHALRSAFELILEAGNPADPALRVSLGAGIKLGWDNPDNIHHNASLRGDCSYRLSGTRGEALYFSLGVYAGSYSKGGSRTIAFTEIDAFEMGDDDYFEVILSPHEHPGNWIRLEPDTSSMMLRQIFSDRAAQAPAQLKLERIDQTPAPRALRARDITSGLKRITGMVRGTNQVIFGWADRFREQPNRFLPGDVDENESLQGIPDQSLAGGWWEIAPDEAIVIRFEAPVCRYWSFVLSNYWGQSLDYNRHACYVNDRHVTDADDGSIVLIVAHSDPQVRGAHWIDTAGHDSGVWQFRWLQATRYDIPTPEVVSWQSLRNAATHTAR